MTTERKDAARATAADASRRHYSRSATSVGPKRKPSKAATSRVSAIVQALENWYGLPEAGRIDPIDLLVQTILSQNTSDLNSGRAFSALRSAFPDNLGLLEAPLERIAQLIRPGGLGDMKAARIRSALERIEEDFGRVDLSCLADMPLSQARQYLIGLPGVGPKTAAVVLLFAFGKPTMPVDTHVHRLCRRLGLVPEKASVQRTQELMEAVTPPGKYLSLHLNLIRHGRRFFRARSPNCDECPIRALCPYPEMAASGQKD